MKKLLAFAAIVLVGAASIGMWQTFRPHAAPATKIVTPPLAAPVEPPQKKSPGYALPAHISIERLGIDQDIVPVGKTSGGDMDIPGELHQLAWYKHSPAPGNIGNAVIAGHRGITQTPGVLWRANELQVGDAITVTDLQQQVAYFRITSIERFTPQNAPRERIFGMTSQRALRLITCDGTWMPHTQDYSHRLVIFAELQDE